LGHLGSVMWVTPNALCRRPARKLLAFPIFTLSLLDVALCSTPIAPTPNRMLSELRHTSWTIKDGVRGDVLALAQTTDGYLWLGTADGLCSFDGAHFKRYEPPPVA